MRMGSALLPVFCLLASAAEFEHAPGNRTTPPTVRTVAPLGVPAGAKSTLTVTGYNLAKASAIYFSKAGIHARIVHIRDLPDVDDVRLGGNGTPLTVDLGPLPAHNEVTLELAVGSHVPYGPIAFRLLTPLGTTPEGRFLVEPPLGETAAKKPDNSPDTATETAVPAILTGAITKPGDVDYFKIEAHAGQQLVFVNQAPAIGSTLQPVIRISREDGTVVRETGLDGGPQTFRFAHTFDKTGIYYVGVSDYEDTGRKSNFYRIWMGDFPVATAAYPLGVPSGKGREVALEGWGLLNTKVAVDGKPNWGMEDELLLRPKASATELKLAVGREPEIDNPGANTSGSTALSITAPVTVNGRLEKDAYFRFHARKGQALIAEVNAHRLGADLDSVIEVLDDAGKPVPRALARAVWDTAITLADRDSASVGLRLLAWSELKPGDLVMIGNEIAKVAVMPKGPDEDVRFEQSGGQRLAFFDTTAEAHAIDKPVYKIQLHPPGTTFSPNGLPVVPLHYANDDGGPGYGKDSLLHFTAPADGDYLLRLRDVRGTAKNAAYRLTLREPSPDFSLSVSDRNPNVPAGGAIPITVTALRKDGFNGPITVSVRDLPRGVKAKESVIAPDQVSTTLLLSADAGAVLPGAVPLHVIGSAGALSHSANSEDPLLLLALAPAADVSMTAETRVVDLEPGGQGKITVSIARQNDFHGRVPVDVRNLPPHVIVTDVGLNGVLITEEGTRRTFTVQALPDVPPMEQWIYVSAAVETRSSLPAVYAAPEPVLLRIKPKTSAVAAR